MIDPKEILKKYWGFESFRSLQKEIIQNVLEQKDTLALLPTGGGKSICFQVPALAMDGVCIVVSPLIALMNEQVKDLRKRRIKADFIASGMTPRQIDIALDNCIFGGTKFLYLSPERINSVIIKARLKQMNVSLIAVDEAHCISQWGHDFRPSYRNISILKELHPNIPIIALTATATKNVANDICEQLEFNNEGIFKTSFKRDNIFYSAVKTDNKISIIEKELLQANGAAILYLRSRKKTEFYCKEIQRLGFKAAYYHAGLPLDDRKKIENDWSNGKLNVIVCTTAFGMGMNKSDVRLVMHLDIPATMEEFYQESGRAGRDGEKSKSIVIFNEEDIDYQSKLLLYKFPDRKLIKKIYNSLGNYFQLGTGGAIGKGFALDIKMFSKTYNFEPLQVHYALAILQKEGYIFLSDDTMKSSKVKIVQSRSQIDSFLEKDSFNAELLSTLLRSHTGLFRDFVKFSEGDIAEKMNCDRQKVKNGLQIIEKLGIVEYKPQNFLPQVIYSSERIDTKNLTISKEVLEDRKKVAEKQLNYMFNFLQSENDCRTNIALFYFDEIPDKSCGHCDICLSKKRHLSISQSILEICSKPTTFQELINQLPQSKTEIIEEVRKLLDNKSLIRDGNTIQSV